MLPHVSLAVADFSPLQVSKYVDQHHPCLKLRAYDVVLTGSNLISPNEEQVEMKFHK